MSRPFWERQCQQLTHPKLVGAWLLLVTLLTLVSIPCDQGGDCSSWWHRTRHYFSRSHLGLLTFTVREGWAVFNSRVSDPNKLESGRAAMETKAHFTPGSLPVFWNIPLIPFYVACWRGHKPLTNRLWAVRTTKQWPTERSLCVVQGLSEPASTRWPCQSLL